MKILYYLILLLLFIGLFVSCESNDVPKPYVIVAEKPSTKKDSLFGKPILSHPRLLFTKEEEKTITNLKGKDPLLSNLISLLKVKADELLTTSMIPYPTGASNILDVSREHIHRIITLALAYRLFGDYQYASKAEENLINVCNYPDWNPGEYLDVAEMTEAVSIGYDWLYNILSSETKSLIVKSIKEKALNLAVKEYDSGGSVWANRTSNWNVVCNTGMIMGSLAIAESDSKLAEKIISKGVTFVPNCLMYYSPDGVCYEGTGYWYYTNINLAMLLRSLNDNLDQDYGLSDLPGISKTAEYYVASVSPSGQIFNFADTGGTSPNSGPVYFYFSKKFNLPQVAEFYRSIISGIAQYPGRYPKWHFFLCIPWYDNSSAFSSETPKLQLFDNSLNPILVFNGKSSSANRVYLIAKGGAGNVAHQHLDMGSFIIETNGVRWLDDLGCTSADYALPGFWDYTSVTGQRWKYFRYNNFSHNTISIDNNLQYSTGRGKMLRYKKESDKPFGIIDLTTAYTNLASKVNRGFMLLSDNLALIQDEINLTSKAKQIEWTSITSASITISGNTATLQKGGKSFFIKIISPSNSTFTTAVAKTNSSAEAPVTGYYLLKINTSPSDGINQTIQIVMSSDANEINNSSFTGSLTPLSSWK